LQSTGASDSLDGHQAKLASQLEEAFPSRDIESPRILWRLNTLRGLSHEEVEQVLTRGA
jgi:hypothetical protein